MGRKLYRFGLRGLTAPTYAFHGHAITHIGNCRKNHEDNFFIGEVLAPEEQKYMSQTANRIIRKTICADSSVNRIYAVSDGMGGHENGEVASFMVVDAVKHFVARHQAKAFTKIHDKFNYIQEFQQMIHQTNLNILDCSASTCETDTMGSTLSGIVLFSDEAVTFNIGDSSTLLYVDGALRKLTVDDNEAERFRSVDPAVLEANGKRLTKHFGMAKSSGMLTARVSPPISLRAGQMFLITTDGLTENLSLGEIASIMSESDEDPQTAAAHLVASALGKENGGNDNITVVVLKIQNNFK